MDQVGLQEVHHQGVQDWGDHHLRRHLCYQDLDHSEVLLHHQVHGNHLGRRYLMEHRPQDHYQCIHDVDKARPHHQDNHLDLDQRIPEEKVSDCQCDVVA